MLHSAAPTAADHERLSTELRWPTWIGVVNDLGERCNDLAEGLVDVVRPGVLDVSNSELFGPDASEAYLACARGDASWAHHLIALLLDHVAIVLDHYADDLLAKHGPVTSLWSAPGETHHRRWRVMGLGMSSGGRIAHKVRPVNGERLFLAPDGVFAAVSGAARPGDIVRLPTLDVQVRRDRAGTIYSWAPWLSEPRGAAYDPDSGLTALVTTPTNAPDYWHDAGCLSAAVAAFGITDLGEENVVTADVGGRSMLVPIDIEVFLRQTVGLSPSQLIGRGHHHGGIEQHARTCTGNGPLVTLSGGDAVARSAPCARSRSRSLVLDGKGGAGYGRALPSYLRGAITTWLTICRARIHLEDFLVQACESQLVRVLRRPTADYTDMLTARLLGAPGAWLPGMDETEVAQLAAGDVPYFTAPALAAGWAQRMTLSALGPVLRDAVEAVRDTVSPVVTDAHWGVSVYVSKDSGQRGGCVSAQIDDLGGRVVFFWDESTIRLQLPAPVGRPADPLLPNVRDRLLRLDRADTALRWTWARGGFTDMTVQARLQELVNLGARWLDAALTRYGWPGVAAVGADAAAAAARLAQHLEGHLEVQERALTMLGRAAVEGDAAWADVAGLTDAWRLQRGLDQAYGTKFERLDGRMAPVRLRDLAAANNARAQLGLGTVAEAALNAAALVDRLSHAEATT